MSFQNEISHEVANVRLLPLILAQQQRPGVAFKLATLSDAPIMMTNFQYQASGWFTSTPHIKQRYADLQVCPANIKLGDLLQLQDVQDADQFAISAHHARAIRMSLSGK